MGKENRETLVECTLRGFIVPGAGIEPARIAPLVFETSASTDSAIRAGVLFRLPVGVGLRGQGGCRGIRAAFEAGALTRSERGTGRIAFLNKDCKGIGFFRKCKIFRGT